MVTKNPYLQGGVIMVGPEIEITLKKKKKFENGRLQFEEYRFRAVEVFHENKLKQDRFGIENSCCFVLKPGKAVPAPGDRICVSSKEHEILITRMCVDITGKCRGIRCVTG